MLSVSLAVPAGILAAPSPTGATIASDKADYAPGETVTLTGTGWAAGETVEIVVNDTIGQTWSHTAPVTATGLGVVSDVFQLPTYFVSDYDVTATGPISGSATTTFTDALGLNLDQCQNIDLTHLNDPCGTVAPPAHPTWDNGNINQSNSQYREGDGLPYRNAVTGLAAGTWVIRVDYPLQPHAGLQPVSQPD
jgi:hypothetical protein